MTVQVNYNFAPKKANYDGMWFNSNLEAKVAEKLDEQGRSWSYESMVFRDKRFRGGQYTPDFYIDGERLYVEVVGKLDDRHLSNASVLVEKLEPDERFEFVIGNGDVLDCLGNATGRNMFALDVFQSKCDFPAARYDGDHVQSAPSDEPASDNVVEDTGYVYGDDASAAYSDVSIGLVRISPDDAKRLLEESGADWKKLRPDALESVLRNGNWILNGATITFSKTGKIKDGSKRLAACVRTGIPIDTFLVWGVDDDVDPTVGIGFNRSVADHLKMSGYTNCNALAAAGRAMYFFNEEGIELYFTARSHGHPGGKRLSEEDYYNYIVDNYNNGANIHRVLNISLKVTQAFKHVTTGTMAVLLSEFLRIDSAKCETFINQLVGNEHPCDQIEKLEKKLKDNSSRQGKPKESQEVIGAWFIKTWNAFISGKKLSRIQYLTTDGKREKFPRVLAG